VHPLGVIIAALFGLAIQYLVITVAVRHGVVSAQKVLDKQTAKANRATAQLRHHGMTVAR